jgi:hypothetical protein
VSHRICSEMMPRRRPLVLRTSYFVLPLALALLLSACAFTTDTVATVGGTEITRGALNAALAPLPPQARDVGEALDRLIFYRLLELEARAQRIEITADEITARNNAELAAIGQQFTGSGIATADIFQQEALGQGVGSGAGYRQGLREQLLIEKLRPYWYKSPVDVATTRLLFTDTREKAVEAAQKGRGGTSFDELLRTYAPANAQTPNAVNGLGSLPTEALSAQFRANFPGGEIRQGSYSEPIEFRPGQFVVIHVAAVERRAPSPEEERYLLAPYVNSLRTKYGVTVDPSLGLPGLNTPRTAP